MCEAQRAKRKVQSELIRCRNPNMGYRMPVIEPCAPSLELSPLVRALFVCFFFFVSLGGCVFFIFYFLWLGGGSVSSFFCHSAWCFFIIFYLGGAEQLCVISPIL